VVEVIYFDHSATTKANSHVIKQFVIDNEELFANSNSLHKFGKEATIKLFEASNSIKNTLGLKDYDIVFTSGATESNNLAIKGIAEARFTQGKKIITSPFEHSSITSCLNYLAKKGYQIDVLDIDDEGLVDLEELKQLLTADTVLVTIGAVNSETGITQDIDSISKIIKEYPNAIFHSDMTQAIGKVNLNFSTVDLISFSAHKFYGLKGIGGLFVRNNVVLTQQIHGGKSFSKYRAGTPALPLILSIKNALDSAYKNFDEKLKKIKVLHDYLLSNLRLIDNVVINSNSHSIEQIVNVSFLDILATKLHKLLSEKEIYVSTTTACSSDRPMSLTIKRLSGSIELAETSIRISLSHLNTIDEVKILIKSIKDIILNQTR